MAPHFETAETYLQRVLSAHGDDAEADATVDRWLQVAEVHALLAIADALRSRR